MDVIPASLSSEAEQNSEPSIAVNPANPSQILIGSFDNASPNPYFLSTDGGSAWSQLTTLRHADETLEWSPGGTAYTARASSNRRSSVLLLQPSCVADSSWDRPSR